MPSFLPPRLTWDLCLGLAITCVFLALNIHDAVHLHLWYDEGWTLAEITGVLTGEGIALPQGTMPSEAFAQAAATTGPFHEVAASLYHHDVHPPLYFQALWAWTHLFGTSPLALRGLSIVCMTAVAWLVFCHVRRRAGPAALLALTILLASPGAAYAAVNARGYGLALLVSTLALIGVLRAVQGAHPKRWALLAGVCTGIAAMAHYFTLLVLGPVCVVGVVFLLGRRQWAAFGIAIASALPGLLTTGLVWLPKHLGARPDQMQGFAGWPIETFSLFRVFVNQFTRYSLDHMAIALLTTIASACLLAALVQQARRHWRAPHIIIPFAGLAGMVVLLLALFYATDKTLAAFSVPRYGVFALPCMALLLAHMASTPWTQKPQVLVPAMAMLVLAGLLPRLDAPTFDQPWVNHTPSHKAQEALEQAALNPQALLVIVGTEPGMIGTTLSSLPEGLPTLHAPTADEIPAALDGVQEVHMRPVPWEWGDGRPPFPKAFRHALEAQGFVQQDGVTWARPTAP